MRIHRTAYDGDDPCLSMWQCRVTWGIMIHFANFIFLYAFRITFRSHFMLIWNIYNIKLTIKPHFTCHVWSNANPKNFGNSDLCFKTCLGLYEVLMNTPSLIIPPPCTVLTNSSCSFALMIEEYYSIDFWSTLNAVPLRLIVVRGTQVLRIEIYLVCTFRIISIH